MRSPNLLFFTVQPYRVRKLMDIQAKLVQALLFTLLLRILSSLKYLHF